MKTVVKRVTTMVKTPFPNEHYFNFEAIERQVAEIKKRMAEKGQIIDVSGTAIEDGEGNEQTEAKEEMEAKAETIEDLLKNQLSILQDIQYLLTQLEKQSRKKKRSFFFGKNDLET